MNKEVDLSVSCYGKVKDRKYDIVILPWGATEPHNLHLPYMTDCILSHDVAVDAALIAKQKYGVNCMVMPPIGMVHKIRDNGNFPSVSIRVMKHRKQY